MSDIWNDVTNEYDLK